MEKEKIIKFGMVAVGGYFLLNMISSTQPKEIDSSTFQPKGLFDFGGISRPATYADSPEYTAPAPSNISIVQEAPIFPSGVFPQDNYNKKQKKIIPSYNSIIPNLTPNVPQGKYQYSHVARKKVQSNNVNYSGVRDLMNKSFANNQSIAPSKKKTNKITPVGYPTLFPSAPSKSAVGSPFSIGGK